jgi:hypothetical protein
LNKIQHQIQAKDKLCSESDQRSNRLKLENDSLNEYKEKAANKINNLSAALNKEHDLQSELAAQIGILKKQFGHLKINK